MSDNEKIALSRFPDQPKTRDFLRLKDNSLGQNCPQHCPTPNRGDLGEPLSIVEVAALLGCSVWTVRQKYLPQGLPHLRASAFGKIVFFREQVMHWILNRQQKERRK